MLLFSILNFALYLKENPLNYLLLQSVFQMICKRFVSKRMMLLHVPTTPPWFLTHPVVNFTLHCSDKSNTPPDMFKHRFYELYHEFKYYYRIFTDGSKKVTELQLLWSIETILSVFDYLIQQASSELNYMPYCLR